MKKLNKRIAVWLLIATMAMGMCTPISAASNRVSIMVDGQAVQISAYVDGNNRTQVPTSIAQSLGMTVEEKENQVLFTRNGVTKIFTIGESAVGSLQMDTSAVKQDGTTYVPLFYLGKAFGMAVSWDASKRCAVVHTEQNQAINLSGVPAPSYDYTRANRLPMRGYLEKTLFYVQPDGTEATRTVKIYISEQAIVRPYFTIISVPDGVDTTEFLQKSGWFALADENEECLLILESENGVWGDLEQEYAYVQAAIDFYKNPVSDTPALDADKTSAYFSTYGMNYFVGYGAGAPALELWAANNPAFMISQVYIDSQGLQTAQLEQAAEQYYDGDEAGTNLPLNVAQDEWIYYNEIPVPTWFINCENTDSLNYWKTANDCMTTAVTDRVLGEVYVQQEQSKAWQTEYYGPISKVAKLESNSFDLYGETQKIYDFLTAYTRYDNTCAFASQLSYRERLVDMLEKGTLRRDTMDVGGEAREYYVYVPENAKSKYPNGSPLIFVWAGNTQSDLVFLEATSWRTLADENGFICVFPSEQYNASSSVSVSHKNTDEFYLKLRTALKQSGENIDWTRVYCVGQSAGSLVTNTVASSTPEYYAAFSSTSGPTLANSETSSNSGIDMIETLPYRTAPNYLLVGTGDIAARTGSLFDEDKNQLDMWADYFLSANKTGSLNDYTSKEVSGLHDRFTTYTWTTADKIPLTKVTMTAYRNHNCILQEMPLMWEYLSHFSYEWDGETDHVTRYYSASAFEKDDAVVIK